MRQIKGFEKVLFDIKKLEERFLIAKSLSQIEDYRILIFFFEFKVIIYCIAQEFKIRDHFSQIFLNFLSFWKRMIKFFF